MRTRVVGLLALVALLPLLATPLWGAAKSCLTGTDSSVANDAAQIAGVRMLIDAGCTCGGFDGNAGKTHRDYLACAKAIIDAQVTAGSLRKQCKGIVTRYYRKSTCGVPATKNSVPCIEKNVSTGKVTCTVKPSSKCVSNSGGFTQVPCPGFTTCIDAADSNGDLLVASPHDLTMPRLWPLDTAPRIV